MALIYITGASGAGKSTVRAELRRRGYPAHGTDEDGLSRWFDNRTGAEVSMPTDPAHRDDNWFMHHTYRLPPETVLRVAAAVGDKVGFICGTVGNDDQIWDLFTAVISLSIDAATVRRRLAERVDSFGSTEDELQRVLAWHANVDADNRRFGAILIDASPPVTEVVDHLLTELELVPGLADGEPDL
ncbi:AAA family ATPase [Kribbella alba]|uniref:AAA family ATPase n=1 Tax=Kribbella alba TaxID=190197 RepID=A0ABN2FLJ9_9ACTN